MTIRTRLRNTVVLALATTTMLGALATHSPAAHAASTTTTTTPLPALGAVKSPNLPAPQRLVTAGAVTSVPASVDLTPWTEIPKHQGNYGSCVTWAIDYGLLGWYSHHDAKLGAPFAPFYTYSQIKLAADDGLANGINEGGSNPSAALNVAMNQGSDTRADYVPQGETDPNTLPTAAQKANASHYRITNWHTVITSAGALGNADAIKAELAAGRPVAFTVPVRPGFDALNGNSSATAVDNDTTGAIRGYHEILALGYDSSGLLFQNSWGSGFGHAQDVFGTSAGSVMAGGFGRLSWNVVSHDVTEAEAIDGFTVTGTAPTISSLSPTSGPAGTSVAISGTGLTGATSVKFNGVAASATINSSTKITATVPAAATTGKVTVTTPNGTATSTATFTVTSASVSSDMLRNAGFESGSASPAPWVGTAGVIDGNTAQPAHSGAWKAWLNGLGAANTDTLYQDVTIPAGITSATLSYWLHIDTLETGTAAYDTMRVQIRDTANNVLGTVASYSNANAAAGYSQKAFNVSAYAGRTIRIFFTGTEDASLRTSFIVDDVALSAQLLRNAGFESGSASPAPWVGTAGVIDGNTAQPAHSGAWKAWLNGLGAANTDTLYQDVTIPAGITSATLSYWLHIDSLETGTAAYDTMRVQIRDTANNVLGTVASYSNANAAAGYSQKAFNVSAYAGRTIRIFFTGTEDASLRTSFIVDDVAVTRS